MKIVRFIVQGKPKYGIIDSNNIKGLKGSPFSQFKNSVSSPVFDGNIYRINQVQLLPPCVPSKLVCLGLNYRKHAEEFNLPIPPVPLIFIKPSTAVIGPDDNIVIPIGSKRVDYEAELGVVIGKKVKNVPLDKTKDYILGYTCVNDVTERHNQKDDGQWTRAKGYDTFAPIGPWIETELVPDNLLVEAILNGNTCQSANTSDLIFSITELISFISSIMTLLPGDIIATGTPSGVGRINSGDIIEIRIEGIGTLRNSVSQQN